MSNQLKACLAASAATFPQEDVALWDEIQQLVGVASAQNFNSLSLRHILYAIGNFKRQGGTILRLQGLLPLPPVGRGQVPSSIAFGSVHLSASSPSTWRNLENAAPGLAVSTTTALLSALWPEDHVIMDQRVGPPPSLPPRST